MSKRNPPPEGGRYAKVTRTGKNAPSPRGYFERLVRKSRSRKVNMLHDLLMRLPSPPLCSLFADDRAFVITVEYLLVVVLALLGLLVGLVAVRDAVISEISDLAGSVQDINQCYSINGTDGHSGQTHGMSFTDEVDFCDDAEDTAGEADNCIVFDASPSDEGGEVSTEGLDAAIDFSDGASDTSPGGGDNSGTLEGDAEVIDGVLVLDGNGDFVSFENSDDINLGIQEERSVLLDFKLDDVDERQVLYEEGGTVRGLNIYVDGGMLYVGGWNRPDSESDWEPTFVSTPITAGEWFSAAFVLDGGPTLEPGALTGYLNGDAFGSTAGSQLWQHPGNIAIGGANGGTFFHDGSSSGGGFTAGGCIDNFQLYNRPLSSGEIDALSL